MELNFDSLLDETLTSPSSVPWRHVQGMQSVMVKPKGWVVSKIRGLGQGESQVRPLIHGLDPS